MDLEKIAGLVKIIEDSSLKEFTYKEGDMKITMSKREHPPIVTAGIPAVPGSGVAQGTPLREQRQRRKSPCSSHPLL